MKCNQSEDYIVHIFPKQKFTDGYVNFVNENFLQQHHRFYFYGNRTNVDSVNEANVKVISGYFIQWISILPVLYKSSGIILHNFDPKQIIVLLYLQPWLLKKLNIVFWGADLYSSYNDPKDTLLRKIYAKIKSKVISESMFITTLVRKDYELVKDWYDNDGINFQGYYMDKNHDYLKELKYQDEKDVDENVNILLGNNAQKSNEHIEMLNKLKVYKDDNIKIYVPLSYSGDNEYIKQVIETGESIFGEKFVPLVKFIPQKEYYNLLVKIDIGVFNNTRQQAMGNISALTFLGAKVYIREDTTMWDHYVIDNDFKLYSVEDICNLSFNSFKHIENETSDYNTRLMNNFRSKSRSFLIWEKIFNKMKIQNDLKEGNNG